MRGYRWTKGTHRAGTSNPRGSRLRVQVAEVMHRERGGCTPRPQPTPNPHSIGTDLAGPPATPPGGEESSGLHPRESSPEPTSIGRVTRGLPPVTYDGS